MSKYDIFGVGPEDIHHPSEKAGKEELGQTPGTVGIDRIDGNRMFRSTLGNQDMKAKTRTEAMSGNGVTRVRPGQFRVRRRTLKG